MQVLCVTQAFEMSEFSRVVMARLAYFRNRLLQDNDSFTIVKDESLGTEEKSQKDQVVTASKQKATELLVLE